MRKGQTSEFIAITLLVIVLTIILLFSKLNQSRNRITKTESSLQDFKNVFISTSVTKFPYITYKGVAIDEMLGAFMCYKTENVDYGKGGIGTVQVINFPRQTLNELYGAGNWRIELNESYCFDDKPMRYEPCEYPEGEYISYEMYLPLSCRVGMAYGKIFISTS
jgi:hypothetical protein